MTDELKNTGLEQKKKEYEFHVLYTNRLGEMKEDIRTATSIIEVEDWLKEIKAQYWEIGLPTNYR